MTHHIPTPEHITQPTHSQAYADTQSFLPNNRQLRQIWGEIEAQAPDPVEPEFIEQEKRFAAYISEIEALDGYDPGAELERIDSHIWY